MGDDGESLAILPRSMGDQKPGTQLKKKDPKKYIPQQKGGLLLENPNEEESPYTFSDSPAYLAKKKFEEQSKRAAELEQKDETRGFLRHVEELGKKHKWEEAFQILERRTAVPSGLFLVTRAVLRWKFCKYSAALRDIDDALKSYGSSAKSGPLAAAFSSFARICMGSEAKDKGSCSKEMRSLVEAWQAKEEASLAGHALGQGLFKPRKEERCAEAWTEVVEGMEAQDGTYVAASGLRIGYVFLKNKKDPLAPLLVHFHGTAETAADYRTAKLAERYRDLPVHLLVVDYRGYGWSGGEPSLATFLRDAEPLAEKLPEIAVQHGLSWPYTSGLILSGRSVGSQVAVHLAATYPDLFRGLLLDSSLATSATGDRLGKANERTEALDQWRKELEKASLDVLTPLADPDMRVLSVLEKIKGYDGQLLIIHGLADEVVPYEGSESLHTGATSKQKEMVLVEGAGHNNIGHFDAYWSAMRRFALKIQLENSLPKVGAKVEHLCALPTCNEKATLMCGRCEKVWYCNRECQVLHWPEHKLVCAGGPPEKKVKVVPEEEATVLAVLGANVLDDEGVTQLSACLASLAAQAAPTLPEKEQNKPRLAVYVSWYAEEAMVEQVSKLMESFKTQNAAAFMQVVAVQSERSLTTFEHAAAMSSAMAKEGAAAHAWVVLLEPAGIWSSRFMPVVIPTLRKAAADQRVLAVKCSRHAEAKDDLQSPADGNAVGAAVESGAAVISDADDQETQPTQFLVRLKSFRAFFDSTPAQALTHPLCAYRFSHRLQNTFGKKVLSLAAPEGEWLRWRPRGAASPSSCSAEDAERGRLLFESSQPAAPAEGAEEGEEAPAPKGRFASEEEAGRALLRLRLRIERRLILQAGEKLAAKDFRLLASEEMAQFLEDTELDSVVGIQRWAKQTSTEIAERAAKIFSVELA